MDQVAAFTAMVVSYFAGWCFLYMHARKGESTAEAFARFLRGVLYQGFTHSPTSDRVDVREDLPPHSTPLQESTDEQVPVSRERYPR